MRLYQRLVEKFWEDFVFTCTWWRVDYLQNPAIAHDAVAAAIEADLIVFSLHATAPLPAMMPGWISQWIYRNTDQRGGLVLLIEGCAYPPDSLRATQAYFQEIADKARMDFFLCPVNSTDQMQSRLEERARTVSPLLREILQRVPEFNYPRWGLNE
jgi:hypothetical protein